jgi:hypothetical protein
LHPVLASKPVQGAGAVLRVILQSKANIDISNVFQNLGVNQNNGTQVNKKLIIIDDIERTSLTSSQVFGYFSEYIIQFNTKIIFIGNEEKIGNKDDEKDGKRNEYLIIKEKTLGLEFIIEPDIENAIKYFLEDLDIGNGLKKEKSIKKFVSNTCKELILKFKCKNLRIIRQGLYNLNILIQNLNQKTNEGHLYIIIRIFLVLFIQKSLNKIQTVEQVSGAIDAYEGHGLDYESYLEQEKENRWYFSHVDHYIPLLSCWGEIILNSNYSSQYINSQYLHEVKVIKEKSKMKTLFYLRGNWLDMPKDLFIETIKKVDKELEDGLYLHSGEILHYFDLLAFFLIFDLLHGFWKAIVHY